MRASPPSRPSPLSQVSDSLTCLDPRARRSVVLRALSFLPDDSFAESFRTGEVRVLLADCWENLFAQAVPVQKLRSILTGELPGDVEKSLCDMEVASSYEETAGCVASLLRLLHSHAERPKQLSLFVDRTEPKSSGAPRQVFPAEAVYDLGKLLAQGRKFRTVLADPPWPYENEASRGAAANHYSTMSLEEICNEPVRHLADENAHLHLWTTNAFLREAFTVIEAWGFEYRSCFVWVKPDIGMGNYWRVSHEFLLLGVRGRAVFLDRTRRSWLECGRTVHSKKPEAVRLLIERVSPGPYLELYGRVHCPTAPWTVYGNQIERHLF